MNFFREFSAILVLILAINAKGQKLFYAELIVYGSLKEKFQDNVEWLLAAEAEQSLPLQPLRHMDIKSV